MQPGGPTSVVVMDGTAVRVLTPAGDWRASPAGGRLDGEAVRDALVAGFVPGISLGWSWPDMLRHAAALAAAVQPSGAADLAAYERLLGGITVTGPGRTSPGPG